MDEESLLQVKLNRGKRGIALAKATYDGLNKAFPLEYYQWFPEWVKEDNIKNLCVFALSPAL